MYKDRDEKSYEIYGNFAAVQRLSFHVQYTIYGFLGPTWSRKVHNHEMFLGLAHCRSLLRLPAWSIRKTGWKF